MGAASATGEGCRQSGDSTPSGEFDNRAERVRAACKLQAEKVAIRIGAQVRNIEERVQTRGYVGKKSRRRGVTARNLGDFVSRPDAVCSAMNGCAAKIAIGINEQMAVGVGTVAGRGRE